ncbi:hypothetical protein [Haladaptatus sp. CMAA 1911]|uniref:hypothetical protein n=1 Tax=unclassified Haladaptatus TaxID=2622732 RepID=UPI003754ED7A
MKLVRMSNPQLLAEKLEVAILNWYYVGARTVLTVFLHPLVVYIDAMCHCFGSIDELNEQEREELVEEHNVEELRTEHTEDELEMLGVTA